MVLSIDEVNDILDRVYDEFPEALFQELNGGVLLLEDALPDPDAGEDVYIMGEYCVDGLGDRTGWGGISTSITAPSPPCSLTSPAGCGRRSCAPPCATS